MVSSFQGGILLRVAGLVAILALLAWMAAYTTWYVTMGICAAAAVAQVAILSHYASRAGREIARFLDAIASDDTTVSVPALARDRSFDALGTAMGRVLERLRTGRAEREEQSQYLQSLLAHMP